jgi:hypothetical protein
MRVALDAGLIAKIRGNEMSEVWIVEQNGTVVCGVLMGLSRSAAENKVNHEGQMGGWGWRARPASDRELHPQEWIEEICED